MFEIQQEIEIQFYQILQMLLPIRLQINDNEDDDVIDDSAEEHINIHSTIPRFEIK